MRGHLSPGPAAFCGTAPAGPSGRPGDSELPGGHPGGGGARPPLPQRGGRTCWERWRPGRQVFFLFTKQSRLGARKMSRSLGSAATALPSAPGGLLLPGASWSRCDADARPRSAPWGPPPAAEPRRDLPRCEGTHRPRSCRLLRDRLSHLRPRRHLRPIASEGARKKRCFIDAPPTNFARPLAATHWLAQLPLVLNGSPIGPDGIAILAEGPPQVWPHNGNRVPNRFRVSALEFLPLAIRGLPLCAQALA